MQRIRLITIIGYLQGTIKTLAGQTGSTDHPGVLISLEYLEELWKERDTLCLDQE